MVSMIPSQTSQGDDSVHKFQIENITGLWTSPNALHWMGTVVLVRPTGSSRIPPTAIPETILSDLGPYVDRDVLDLAKLKYFVVVTLKNLSTPLVFVFRRKSLQRDFVVLIQTLQKVFHLPVALSDVE